MQANLCVVYVDMLREPGVVIVDRYDLWADANALAQRLNKQIDMMNSPWYFKAIGITNEDNLR